MPSIAGVPIKGKIIRVVATDVCGVPVTGAGSRVVITNSFTKVTATPQYEAGTEFFERTADGSICVNQIDPPILKRFNLDIDLCAVDPDMLPLLLQARELTSTGPVSGYGFAIPEGVPTQHFSLEVWQQVGGSGACDPTGLQRYIYNAFPHVYNGQIQAYSAENAKSVLSISANTQAASPLWGDGPGTGTSWLPAGAGGLVGASDHWLWDITTVAPPIPGVGYIALT